MLAAYGPGTVTMTTQNETRHGDILTGFAGEGVVDSRRVWVPVGEQAQADLWWHPSMTRAYRLHLATLV